MQILTLLGLTLTVISGALSVPTALTDYPSENQFFKLRGNAPQKPWDGRHLVALHTTNQLGFENHTVHPSTPPIVFLPFLLANGNFALRGEGVGDDLSATPWLAALMSTTEPQTVGMKVVYLPSPTSESVRLNPDMCPPEYICQVDQWGLDEPAPGSKLRSLSYKGYSGVWSAVKNAGKEGWHVYWTQKAEVDHDIKLDFVPMGVKDPDSPPDSAKV